MRNAETFASTLECSISNLTASKVDMLSTTTLENGEPFRLSMDISFNDTANGEFAKLLVSAGFTLRTTFYAKSNGSTHILDLGSTTLNTKANVFTYKAVLNVENPLGVGLSADENYQIGAISRVENSPFCLPSLMRCTIEGLKLQIGHPKAGNSKQKEITDETEMEIAAPRTSRRKSAQMEKISKK